MVVLKNAGLWIGGYDFAGVTNEVNLSAGAVAQEADVIANDWKDYEPGLLFSSMSLQGLFRNTDAKQFSSIAQEEMMLVVPAGQAPGGVGYVVPFIASGHELAGSIGELLAFSYATQGKGEMFRAQVMDIRKGVTADVSSTRLNLGPILTGETLEVWVHVTRRTGRVQIELESATTGTTTFITTRDVEAGINTTRLLKFSVAGPVTDEWWQLKYDFNVGSPDFDFASAVAIE